MASINLSELHSAGSELFQDSESFLNELGDVDSISGGGGYSGVSDMSGLTKLAEAWVVTYGIGHIALVAKSFSSNGYY
ncbi:hypothetical protein I8752_36705 [Nostocaceae cyanobacterium CENA369]|uniref:Uncharacterized protein n=1 Tax=Dendronalium phyllosphericum CENA369 TaxID=1725256 RepID=A0A8J7LL14_9NOST|nr:hypothetical protein [Dendronalium phyllosphericum]MBH8578383.1 hypothetical protein [Dendronalium phyllosphericum CENA369]